MTVAHRPTPDAPPARGEIWLVALDPTLGSEVRKTRPCLVVSSDALAAMPLRIVVPISGWQPHHTHHWTRVRIEPDKYNGLDKASGADALQIRCIAVERFRIKLGRIDPEELVDVAEAVKLAIDAV